MQLSKAPTRPRWQRWLRRMPLWISLALVAGYFGGVIFAPVLLRVERDVPNADVIVVLGGESWTRAPRAAELYREHRAPLVLISGAGDDLESRRALRQAGVPASAILIEGKSNTTAENARFTIPMLRERGLTNVILVTSWFHSRRALSCFEHYAPDLRFGMQPTPVTHKGIWPSRYERQRILLEYAKMAAYVFQHGFLPV